jgi:hypothetical protein
VPLHSINLSTGADTPSSEQIYAGTVARKAPTLSTIYLATTNLSPDNIDAWSIGAGAATFGHESPYWGTYPFCGEMWFSADGARIYTRCGNVFNISADPTKDLTYAGSFGIAYTGTIVSIAPVSAAGKVAAVFSSTSSSDGDTTLQSFTDPYLVASSTTPLPQLIEDHALVASHGQFVLPDADGHTVHVIAHVDGATPRTILWSTTY